MRGLRHGGGGTAECCGLWYSGDGGSAGDVGCRSWLCDTLLVLCPLNAEQQGQVHKVAGVPPPGPFNWHAQLSHQHRPTLSQPPRTHLVPHHPGAPPGPAAPLHRVSRVSGRDGQDWGERGKGWLAMVRTRAWQGPVPDFLLCPRPRGCGCEILTIWQHVCTLRRSTSLLPTNCPITAPLRNPVTQPLSLLSYLRPRVREPWWW